MINDASTFPIPTSQDLQSVFAVGGQSITEQYRLIIFPSTQAVANVSTAATGPAVGPLPTGSTQPFVGAASRTRCGIGMAVVVLCDVCLVVLWKLLRKALLPWSLACEFLYQQTYNK